MDRWSGIDAFVAVAETGSFTRAAERLGASVSHVSRKVGLLERRLGTKLLVRTTRRVAVTEAGHIFVERCRRLVEGREAAFESVSSQAGELAGQLRVTCSIAYGERTIVPLINRFLLDFPRISIEIDLTNRVLDLIADGFDLAIRTGRTLDPRLRGTWLASRSIHLCAAPEYLERHGAPTSLHDLHDHRCVLGTADHWEFSAGGRELVIRPEARWRCNNGFGVLDAALCGIGICQLPDFYVLPHLAAGRLVELLEPDRPEDQGIWAIHPERTHQHEKLARIVAFLADHLSGAQAVTSAAAG